MNNNGEETGSDKFEECVSEIDDDNFSTTAVVNDRDSNGVNDDGKKTVSNEFEEFNSAIVDDSEKHVPTDDNVSNLDAEETSFGVDAANMRARIAAKDRGILKRDEAQVQHQFRQNVLRYQLETQARTADQERQALEEIQKAQRELVDNVHKISDANRQRRLAELKRNAHKVLTTKQQMNLAHELGQGEAIDKAFADLQTNYLSELSAFNNNLESEAVSSQKKLTGDFEKYAFSDDNQQFTVKRPVFGSTGGSGETNDQ